MPLAMKPAPYRIGNPPRTLQKARLDNIALVPASTLPSYTVMAKKAARKKLLEEVRKRRYQIGKYRHAKEQRAYQDNEEYREYQDTIASNQ